MPTGDPADWSRIELLLLRAENLLHGCADSLERERQARRLDREGIASRLIDLGRPLRQLRLDMGNLAESMAADADPLSTLAWNAQLLEQRQALEQALIELERLQVHLTDPLDSRREDGMQSQFERIELRHRGGRQEGIVCQLSGEPFDLSLDPGLDSIED